MTAHQCSMCTRPTAGPTVTGLCAYCVNHKCKPENAERIRAKRTAAFHAEQAAALQAHRAREANRLANHGAQDALQQIELRRAEMALR
jgi:hypothetical protein